MKGRTSTKDRRKGCHVTDLCNMVPLLAWGSSVPSVIWASITALYAAASGGCFSASPWLRFLLLALAGLKKPAHIIT